MQLFEIMLIAVIGAGALLFTVLYLVRSARSKGKCTYCSFRESCSDKDKDDSRKCKDFIDRKD